MGKISSIEVGSREKERNKELADSETIDGLLRLVSYFGMPGLIGGEDEERITSTV